MLIVGTRVCYRVVGGGTFHCQKCGGDRPYRHRSGRGWFHLLRVPVLPLASTGDHLRCTICRTCYRVELLAVPTTAQMQAALAAGTKAAALAMLAAGEPASVAARRNAVDLIRAAGSPDCDEASLAAALGRLCLARGTASQTGVTWPDDAPVLGELAVQLEMPAKEWFLANVVRIGLADGPLCAAERQVVRTIAGFLGMTAVQAQDVIWLTEEAAQAG
jgi:hypothetical protein